MQAVQREAVQAGMQQNTAAAATCETFWRLIDPLANLVTSTSRFCRGRTWKFWKKIQFPIYATIIESKVTGGAGRSEWIGSEAKVFQFCRRNNSFLVLSQTLRLKEGGDRVIDFSKRSQNRHCLERRWNPIRKGILLTIKSQNWRINKIVRPALFCWWNIGDNFSHFHLAVTSQHILFDVALLRCSNVTVKRYKTLRNTNVKFVYFVNCCPVSNVKVCDNPS